MDLVTLLASGATVLVVTGALLAAVSRANPTNTYRGWFSGLFGDSTRLPWPSGVQEDYDAPAWDLEEPTAEPSSPEGSVEDPADLPDEEPAAGSIEQAGETPVSSGDAPPSLELAPLRPVVRPRDHDDS